MANTHIIQIPKERFDEIEIGDRLIIQNEEDKVCYFVYVKEEEENK